MGFTAPERVITQASASSDENKVSRLIIESRFGSDREGNDSPVDTIGAVTLGRILVADIRITAEHLLTGSSLFAGGSVSGLIGKDAGTEGSIGSRRTDGLQGGSNMLRDIPCAALEILFLDPLRNTDVLRDAAAQSELTELERVGTIGRSLSGRYELIRRRDGVMDDSGQFDQHILLHRIHLRPVLDIRSVTKFDSRVCLSESIEDPVLVDPVIEGVRLMRIFVFDVSRGRDDTAVGSRCGNRAGIHQGNERNLPLTGL